jgi:hypothetical protein
MIGKISTGLILFTSIDLCSLSNDESNKIAVHSHIVLIAVDAIGLTAVIVFILAGTTVGVVTGHIELAVIHVAVKTFLTALFVLSINLFDFLSFKLDSLELIEFGLLIMEVNSYYDKIICSVKEFIFFI